MQWLAMITMLTDHLGYAFFPDERYLRVIGRIAFPIYCYFLVLGYQRTRNVRKYTIRLLLIAALSQLPFMYAFDITNLNVVCTLFISLLLMIVIDKLSLKYFPVSLLLILAVGWLADHLHMDYGMYGVLLVLVFRYTTGYWVIVAHLALTVVFVLFGGFSDIQVFSVLATALIAIHLNLYPKTKLYSPPRWIWRSFYPAHLAIIAIIRLVF